MIGRIALGGGIAAAVAAGAGWVIARRLTAPVGPRTFDLTIRSVEHDDNGDLIVLDRTDQTTAPGIYNPLVRARRLGPALHRDHRSRAHPRRAKDQGHLTRPHPEGPRPCLLERHLLRHPSRRRTPHT